MIRMFETKCLIKIISLLSYSLLVTTINPYMAILLPRKGLKN